MIENPNTTRFYMVECSKCKDVTKHWLNGKCMVCKEYIS